MLVRFDGTAARGAQWTVILDDGTVLAGVSQATALGALQGSGNSIREAAVAVAQAKIANAKHSTAS